MTVLYKLAMLLTVNFELKIKSNEFQGFYN